MKYFLVVAVFVSVFLLSQIIPEIDSEWFFVNQSLWSLLVITIITAITKTKIVAVICIFEILHIMLNLVSCIEYSLSLTPNLFYSYYEHIQKALNFFEALILLWGFDCSGNLNRIKCLLGNSVHSATDAGSGSGSIRIYNFSFFKKK